MRAGCAVSVADGVGDGVGDISCANFEADALVDGVLAVDAPKHVVEALGEQLHGSDPVSNDAVLHGPAKVRLLPYFFLLPYFHDIHRLIYRLWSRVAACGGSASWLSLGQQAGRLEEAADSRMDRRRTFNGGFCRGGPKESCAALCARFS